MRCSAVWFKSWMSFAVWCTVATKELYCFCWTKTSRRGKWLWQRRGLIWICVSDVDSAVNSAPRSSNSETIRPGSKIPMPATAATASRLSTAALSPLFQWIRIELFRRGSEPLPLSMPAPIPMSHCFSARRHCIGHFSWQTVLFL